MSPTKKALIVLAVIVLVFALTWIPHGGGSAKSSADSTNYAKGQGGGGPIATFGRLTDRGTTLDTARMRSSCGGRDTLVIPPRSPAVPCIVTIGSTPTKKYQFLKLKVVRGAGAAIANGASGAGGSDSHPMPDGGVKLPIGSDGGTITITCPATTSCVLAIVRST